MIEIYTLQLKRICEAAQRLSEGIVYAEAFRTDQAVSVTESLPGSMTAQDYAAMSALSSDLTAMLDKHAAAITTFTAFDGSGLSDPLDILGKRFWEIAP